MTTDERTAAVRHAANEMESWCRGLKPRALVVLGSGLADVADGMEVVGEASFGDLPGFAQASVPGHDGRFLCGRLDDTAVIVMCGRLHLYEGHDAGRVVLPVRAARLLGCDTLIATNAAGAVSTRLEVGATMMFTDHINLTGANPLVGPNIGELGTRFPAMADAYSPRLAGIARGVAARNGTELAEGVYAAVLGPSYETAAEVRYLRSIGADAVGMSTVLETIAARHAGMEVAAFSLIANAAGEIHDSHDSVLAAVAAGAPGLGRIVTGILARL